MINLIFCHKERTLLLVVNLQFSFKYLHFMTVFESETKQVVKIFTMPCSCI